MTNAFIARQVGNPLFQLQAPRAEYVPHTFSRAFRSKAVGWVEKRDLSAMRNSLLRTLSLLAIVAGIIAPEFTLGYLSAFARSRYAVATCVVLAFWYWPLAVAAYQWVAKKRAGRAPKERTGNQHTYRGIPIEEMADYLMENQAFPVGAGAHFGVGQKTWARIAKELEDNDVLVRGENNARVLNEIDRAQLVQQLRDNFPLAFSGGEWVSKEGSYHLYLRDQERREQKERDGTAKIERKRDRLREEIKELAPAVSAFQSVQAMMQ